MALFLFVPIGRPFNPNRSLISQNCSLYKITLCINIYRTLFHSQKRKWLMTIMTETADFYVSCLRPLCFTFAASMFHACGLYLRHMATIREDCVLGRKEAIRGACCALWLWEVGLQTPGCEAGLKHRGWVRAFGLVLFGRAFRGSCFWSSFSWFVLLVVLWVRAFGRSFVVRSSGSCFWGLVCVFCSML